MLTLSGFCAPRNIDQLASAYGAAPELLLLAGGSDIGLWVTKQLYELPAIIYLGEVGELQRIDAMPERLRIVAAVSLTDAWQIIVTPIQHCTNSLSVSPRYRCATPARCAAISRMALRSAMPCRR
jgi:xanthine dehydrogenase iron-sulfur cluster and FAD-binding subunit A